MPRYIALLRGVSPMNAKMPELRACFEQAGFTGVRTVLSSGNVAFDGPESPEPDLVQHIEAAMQTNLGRRFATQVRTIAHLSALLEADPFASFDLPANAKRVVSFLPSSPATLPSLPIIREGARLLAIHGREAFTAYVPDPGNPVFMTLLEKTFGRDITTRTWDTVRKCAVA